MIIVGSIMFALGGLIVYGLIGFLVLYGIYKVYKKFSS